MKKGITIDVDLSGATAVVVPLQAVDEAFIAFIKSEEYIDWLEEAHSGEVDFPYVEPLLIDGKDYDLPTYRVTKDVFCAIGDELSYSDDNIIADLKA